MNIWKMRHQGSPEFLEGLSAEEIVEGVQEQRWEPTDEVKGPGDSEWRSLETHPHFAEAMAELDPPFAPPHPDETRLDMNPLIDVALVLLIFFILTTTYEEMRKMFPPPPASPNDAKGPKISETELREVIRLTARQENGNTVIRVEDEVVPESDLQEKFIFWKEKKKDGSTLAVEIEKGVPWRTFMAIQDAAAGAKIRETLRIERPAE
jgi:biopolymer transport protein ExbD